MAVKLPFKERLEIVQYTLAHDKDYQKAIDKYKISYSQVYSWVRKFEKDGEAALQDKRGKTVKDREFETLSETERLKLEILRLKERNEYLETENIILKKIGRDRKEEIIQVPKKIRFKAIKEALDDDPKLNIRSLCKMLKVSRSGYYRYLSAPKSNRCLENEWLSEIIKRNFML